MPTNIGLYHPYIHFRDDRWLKRSALYWSRMARIVPRSYIRNPESAVLERDSDVTRALIDQCDYVVNIPPSEVTYPVSDVFTRLLVRYEEPLRELYDVTRAAEWDPDPVTTASEYAQLRNPSLAYVHSSKFDDSFMNQLQAARLAQEHNEKGRLWVGMHPRLAQVYMAALAEEAARVNTFSPTTQEPVDHVAALGWGLDRLTAALLGERRIFDVIDAERRSAAARDARRPRAARAGAYQDADTGPVDERVVDPEVPAMLALISVGFPVPADADALSIAQIVKVRDQYGPELRQFQEFVNAFVGQELRDLDPAIADPGAVRAHLRVAYEQQIRPMVADLRRALHGHGIDTVEAVMGASVVVPPVLQPLELPDSVTVSAGAVLSLLPVLRAKRQAAQQAYRNSPVAYLLRLDEELTPQTLPARVGHCVRRFVMGVLLFRLCIGQRQRLSLTDMDNGQYPWQPRSAVQEVAVPARLQTDTDLLDQRGFRLRRRVRRAEPDHGHGHRS
jgi:Family of unknown function (DUF6236)